MTVAGGPVMRCSVCGGETPWNPFGVCSWECYDTPRRTQAETDAVVAAAPEAFAFFLGLGPGEQVEE